MRTTTGTTTGAALALVIGIAGVAGLMLPRAAAAGPAQACSDETLRGHFGLLASGVRGLGPTLTEKFVATALWTFDGQGAFRQRAGGALHGEITGSVADPGEIPGSYQVNPNCTGTMRLFPPEIPFPIEYSFVIVKGGQEVKAIVTAPRLNIVTVELTRR